MRRDSCLGFGEPSGGSTPSEALSFARAILGQSAEPCAAGENGGAIDWEQLTWSASISSRCEAQLRRLAGAGESDVRQREQLAWLAGISTEHERQSQDLLRKEAAAAEVRRRAQQCLEDVGRFREGLSWDPAKHPRLGGPPNAGWFAATGGSLQGTSRRPIAPPKPDSLVAKPQFSDQYLAQAPSGGAGDATGAVARPARQPEGGQPAQEAAQFDAAMRGFLKALDSHVAKWFEKHGKLVRRDTTSFWVMGRSNSDFEIEQSGRQDVYVYYVSDQHSALQVALSIVKEFYTPNTNHWQGPAARFFDPKKDAAQQLADWQKKAFKVGAGHAALLSKMYVYGVLSFNAGADAVVNISEMIEKGISVGTVIGATLVLGAVLSYGKGGALVLKFGKTEVTVANDLAEAFAKLPKAVQADIAKQLAKIDDKGDAANMLARLVREASGSNLPARLQKVVAGIRAPGRFDASVGSLDEAMQAIRGAMPDAVELPRAVAGRPYASPPAGTKKWFQIHPAEPGAGNTLPHIKYADWTNGKKGTGGTWGHIFFR